MITALAFVATLALLVVIHEYGHYRAALACGVKVMRFWAPSTILSQKLACMD